LEARPTLRVFPEEHEEDLEGGLTVRLRQRLYHHLVEEPVESESLRSLQYFSFLQMLL
jgi:hypothetical protein